LFFTEYQVYFGCRRSVFCEDQWEEFENKSEKQPPATKTGLLSLREDDIGSLFMLPARLVKDFSARNFTFDIDRYNAFAEVENELNLQWSFPCSSGMPLDSLVRQLRWNHDNLGQQKAYRISHYPSWSWYRWSSAVSFPKFPIRYQIKDIKLSVEKYFPSL
jgi:hypothetical protein